MKLLAVSGGIDSVVMLHKLVQQDEKIIVAHFDHGMRSSSKSDARFVEALAQQYNKQCIVGTGELRAKASEAEARKARWDFLNQVATEHKTTHIVTAHHKDDLIETMVINILRGTNRKGLTPFARGHHLERPLLSTTKREIYDYGLEHRLEWVEDETNHDQQYLRNRVRQKIVPYLREKQLIGPLLTHYVKLNKLNQMIDPLIVQLSEEMVQECNNNNIIISKHHFAILPNNVATEVLLSLIGNLQFPNYRTTQLKRALVFIENAASGKTFQLGNGIILRTTKSTVTISKQNELKEYNT